MRYYSNLLLEPPRHDVLNRRGDRFGPPRGNADSMRKAGFKALVALLTTGRYSRGHVNWTLAIAIFSSIVTIGIVVLYFMQRAVD